MENGMSLTVNLFYTGKDGAARKFAEEMMASGTVAAIRAEDGNERYEYFQPLEDPETILLIDQSPMMKQLAELRDKYDLHMQVRRYTDDDTMPDSDQSFIRQ